MQSSVADALLTPGRVATKKPDHHRWMDPVKLYFHTRKQCEVL